MRWIWLHEIIPVADSISKQLMSLYKEQSLDYWQNCVTQLKLITPLLVTDRISQWQK